MSDRAAQGETRQKANPFRLGLFLLAMSLVAAFVLVVDSQHITHLLGWSKEPGFLLMSLILFLAGYSFFRRESPLLVALTAVLLTLSVCLDNIFDLIRPIADIFPLPEPVWLLLALLPLLLGGCLVYRMQLRCIAKAAYLVLGGYIESVYIYNAFHPGQYMAFFGGGWIS